MGSWHVYALIVPCWEVGLVCVMFTASRWLQPPSSAFPAQQNLPWSPSLPPDGVPSPFQPVFLFHSSLVHIFGFSGKQDTHAICSWEVLEEISTSPEAGHRSFCRRPSPMSPPRLWGTAVGRQMRLISWEVVLRFLQPSFRVQLHQRKTPTCFSCMRWWGIQKRRPTHPRAWKFKVPNKLAWELTMCLRFTQVSARCQLDWSS